MAGVVVGEVEVRDGGVEVAKVVLVDVEGGEVVGGGGVWVDVEVVWDVDVVVGEVEVSLVGEVSLVDVVFGDVDFSEVESLLSVDVIFLDVVCSDVALVSFVVAVGEVEDETSFFWRLTALSLSRCMLCNSLIMSAIVSENAVVRCKRWRTTD